ncbi:hypothetical protein BD324DRAFT_649632 [Kockovaella imperatae]|uniref:Uncharacterized protein n=1 Tax=Kockovaella imperatae TaxID=4999 RepID=A0A1Y1UM93_9TREE|nr:hypothetical protein BD324DRAFT_649632 [Kockovaella imperatae]ORX38255.1 hypothetical protein BD324DRAFT_649632 [Kockovaella imperatae]
MLQWHRSPLVLLAAFFFLSRARAKLSDPFVNLTEAPLPPLPHELQKRDGNYVKFAVEWPDKSLMEDNKENSRWWSDESWAGGWWYEAGHSANIPGAVVVNYYVNTQNDYMWKTGHATAQVTCTGGFTAPASGSTVTFTVAATSPYVRPTASNGAFFTCAPTLS